MRVRSARPSSPRTASVSTLPPPKAMARSRIDSASRTEPSAARAISASAPCSAAAPSSAAMPARWPASSPLSMRLQVEALAARQHRHRHLARLGGGEDELHMLGRLLERLEQAVEGLLRQHVHLVDDVDLVAGGVRACSGRCRSARGCRRCRCARPRPSRPRRDAGSPGWRGNGRPRLACRGSDRRRLAPRS